MKLFCFEKQDVFPSIVVDLIERAEKASKLRSENEKLRCPGVIPLKTMHI